MNSFDIIFERQSCFPKRRISTVLLLALSITTGLYVQSILFVQTGAILQSIKGNATVYRPLIMNRTAVNSSLSINNSNHMATSSLTLNNTTENRNVSSPEILNSSTSNPPIYPTANANASQKSGLSTSKASNDQPLTIVVQLSGELGNQVHKIGQGMCIKRLVETKLGLKTEIKLRHQDHHKWIHAMAWTKDVFPKTRLLNFEEANTAEFDEIRAFQDEWLQSLDLSLDLGGKIRNLDQLLSMLNQTWYIERPSFPGGNIRYSIPHVYSTLFMEDECVDLIYDDLRKFFTIDEEKNCKLVPDPDETVFHLRNFLTEMPKRSLEFKRRSGFEELSPNQTALQLFANHKPGEKVAIISRYEAHVDEYILALQSLKGLKVRHVKGQSGNEDFCFLLKAQKEIIGTRRSTYFLLAAILGNARRVRAYSLVENFYTYTFSNQELNVRIFYENYKSYD